MGKKINEVGNRYGRLVVLREATKEETNGRKGGIYWKCRCDCGNENIVCGKSLRKGETTSCGCYNKEKVSQIGLKRKKHNRMGETNYNYQGSKMVVVKYNSANNITVEFQDTYKTRVCCCYKDFRKGSIKNPYYHDVYNIGIIGNKYVSRENGKDAKEYKIWHSMIQRCYDEVTQSKQPTYKDCYVSDEWLLYDNFYEWIHEQENYNQWKNNDRWAIDKDIICKGNKKYCKEFCCLIPEKINTLFTKRQNDRGKYPIGVYYYEKGKCFRSQCSDLLLNKRILIGSYDNPIDAFYAYKKYKESLIKRIAIEEYKNKNITKKCYDAMMNYEVEITD